MSDRINITQVSDLNGRTVQKIMDQYEYCMRTQSEDMAVTPVYYLYARPVGDFMVQKHFIDGNGRENMMYYREGVGRNPRTVFEAETATLTYVDFWEAF